MKKVFAYTRVSTVRQGTEGSSLTEQKAAISRYAEANQLHIVQWFEERETAAKQGRPVFAVLFKLLSQNKATGVVIHKIDRSARNLRDWAALGELVDRGIEIHLAHESLDMTSRGGRLAADIQAVVAADYVRNLRQEVKKGIQGRLKQGLLPRQAPTGYLDQGGGKPKIPDPVKAPLIRRLFELYATGRYSYHDLLKEARIMGLTGRNDRPLSLNGLTLIFHNEFYIGIIHHKVSGERYVGIHEPIIPTALFKAVQRSFTERGTHKIIVHDFAYRRMIRCTNCGYSLIGERVKGHVYYRCHTRACPTKALKEEAIDAYFAKGLAGVTLPPETIPALTAEFHELMKERFGSREADGRARTLQRAQIDERLSRLTDRYLDGDIERDLYLSKKEALVAERAMLSEEMERVSEAGRPEGTKLERYLERQKNLYEGLSSFSRPEIAEFMNMATLNVGAQHEKLLIDWKKEFGEALKFAAFPAGIAERGIPRTLVGRDATFKQVAVKLFEAITAVGELGRDGK